MATLQEQIESVNSLPLKAAIQAIADLAPGLTAIFRPEYGYFVTHPSYPGTGNLNDLGAIFLKLGHQCQGDHAPLAVRLMHESMDDTMYNVYGDSYDILKQGLKDGTITPPPPDPSLGCACCRGEPDATILAGFHFKGAFYFDVTEYKELWGDEENSGSTWEAGPDGVSYPTRIMASREQIEEALSRSRSLEVQSML